MYTEEVKILVLNLGSTSTKLAVYIDEEKDFNVSINHTREDLKGYNNVWEQYNYRNEVILDTLIKNGYEIKDFKVIVTRGGTVKPIQGGIYAINESMIKDMQSGIYGDHPTNVGSKVAYDIGHKYNIPVITLDPPVTDEMWTWSRYSGMPEIERQSSFHALNQKATARKLASDLNKKYEDLNLIIVHLGGGISVGAHKNGKVVDVNNALNGDGPFAPERSGGVPVGELIKLCYSNKYTESEVLKLATGGGGLVAYLGTADALEIEDLIKKGDKLAKEVYESMAYQVVKEIGAMAAALSGQVDAIGFTGSIAKSDKITSFIKERVSFIAPVYLYPGENEMESLAMGALRYIYGEEKVQKYI